jgi:hypothetical protein
MLFKSSVSDELMPEVWQSVEFWGVIVAVIACGVGGILAKIQDNTQKKQLKLNALFKVFELLNDMEQRNARGILFDLYRKLRNEGHDLILEVRTNPNKILAHKVESSFDQISVLIQEGLLDKDSFLRIYAGTVIRTWIILEKDIGGERQRTNNNNICKEFENLFIDSVDYYKNVLKKELPTPY